MYRDEELIAMVGKEIPVCPCCKKDWKSLSHKFVEIGVSQFLNTKCDCGFFTTYDEELQQVSYGNYDSIGGVHDQGLGWNPNGVYCGECSFSTCVDCPQRKTTIDETYKRERAIFLSKIKFDKPDYCKCQSDKLFNTLLLDVSVDDLVLNTKEVILKNDYSNFDKEIIQRLAVQDTYKDYTFLFVTIAYCEPCKKVICKINDRLEFVFYLK